MPDSESTAEGVDLAEVLGVDSGVSAQCFSIYVPDKDQFGEEIAMDVE